MKLDLALRAEYVMRWGIVAMGGRGQSVAEHQWKVWLLATAFYDGLFQGTVNSFDRAALQEYALTHDLGECLLGDIPTPAKELIGKEAVRDAERRARKEIAPELAELEDHSLIGVIVKIADIAESIVYLRRWGQDPGEVARICRLLEWALRGQLKELKSGKYLIHDTAVFDRIFEQFVKISPTQLMLSPEP